MKLDGEKERVKTFMGSICSIFILVVVSLYAYQKFDVYMNKLSVDIMTSVQRAHFSADYVFDHEQGLNFAIGFTAFDSETEDILDPSYGKIAFMKYEWGERESGDYFSEYTEIPSHTCTKEELGIEGANTLFMPIPENQRKLVTTYQKKLKCIDPQYSRVNGDFNQDQASLLVMRLVRCGDGTSTRPFQGSEKCKSEAEITEFFRDKFLFLMFNEKIFESSRYEDDSIVQ